VCAVIVLVFGIIYIIYTSHRIGPCIIYPTESFFYPYHMVVAFVTTVIFFVIVLSLRHFMRMKETTFDKDSAKKRKGVIQNADIISLGALIVSIVVTGILPFIQSPLLDYTASIKPNNNDTASIKPNKIVANDTVSIKISNDGLVTAKDVIISIDADNPNLNWTPFKSKPFLASLNNDNYAKGFAEIGNLPPRSETNLTTVSTTPLSNNAAVHPYVRSDAWVGYHDTIPTAVFYSILGTSYVGLFIYMVFANQFMPIERPFWKEYFKNWKDFKDRTILDIGKFLIGFTVYVGLFTILYLYHILIPSSFCF
jgi:hypothetical protein